MAKFVLNEGPVHTYPFCMKTDIFSSVFGFEFTLIHPKTELNEYADKKTELNENGAEQKRISAMGTPKTEEFEYANNDPLTLQPEQSGGVGSSPGRAPPLERHDKGSRTRLGLLYFCDPSAWR